MLTSPTKNEHRDRPGRIGYCRRRVSRSSLFRYARWFHDSAVVAAARVPPQIRTGGATASGSSRLGLARMLEDAWGASREEAGTASLSVRNTSKSFSRAVRVD